MAALLLRLLYHIFSDVDWAYVFVDDFCWILRASKAPWLTPAILGVLLALGTPLSWSGTDVGVVVVMVAMLVMGGNGWRWG